MRVWYLLGGVFATLIHARPIFIEQSEAVALCRDFQYDNGDTLDTESLAHCNHLLTRSDFAPFIQHRTRVVDAALDIAGQLETTLRENERNRKRRRNLAEELCEALNPSSTVNVLSENEPVGISYDGKGLLDGIDIGVNPSILSGIFQTTTYTSSHLPTWTPVPTSTQSHRQTWKERNSSLAAASSASKAPAEASKPSGLVLHGKGLLDGIDVDLYPYKSDSDEKGKDESWEA